jgi:hypothetical protein
MKKAMLVLGTVVLIVLAISSCDPCGELESRCDEKRE